MPLFIFFIKQTSADRRKLFSAFCTNSLAFELFYIIGTLAENAIAIVLFQNDRIIVGIYLNLIFGVKVECFPDLYRKDDPAEIIDISNNSGRFHTGYPFSSTKNVVIFHIKL